MKMKLSLKFIILAGMLSACSSTEKSNKTQMMQPPKAEKKPRELVRHGDVRVDNYYWMRLTDDQKRSEEPDAQTQQVVSYLEQENEYTEAMLTATEPLQEKLYDEMIGRIPQEDQSPPYLDNGYFYYTRFEEGKEYPVYCRKKGSVDAPEEILLDVNEMAEGYSYYQVSGLQVSPDNKILAFSEDTLSRRVYTIRFKDLETGDLLEDKIHFTEPGVAWADDNKTLFYTSKNTISLLSEQIKRHKLGTSDAVDEVVYQEKDPSYYIGCYRSKSGKYIIIYNSSTVSSDYHILKSSNPSGEFHQFTLRGPVHEYSIAHFQDKFYILTNWEATNFRLMEVSENATEKENWKEVVPHREDVLLDNIEVFESFLALEERQGGLKKLRVINQDSGEDYYIPTSETAYSTWISINMVFETPVLRYSYSSLTTPETIYDFNMLTKEQKLVKQQEVVGGHDPAKYTVERIMVESRDGKQIPVSIVYKNGFKKDGNRPFLLYGYGSYGFTIDPGFNSSRLSLLDRGFAFGIAHIRGSQALGRDWYDNGRMSNKMNTFNDFIDCAEFLISENYTSTDHLYAMGGSAGGLLMGAVVNMAPSLFNGIVASVPFVDVLTTMSDPTIPLTTNEYDEWGNPENREEYDYIKTYSPYDNVTAQDYPNLLVVTGFFDSQVQYWEPAKWVAKLRDVKTDDNLLLLNTNMDAGHGGASGRFRKYKEIALEYAFMLHLENYKE